jgi:hypothetical protein
VEIRNVQMVFDLYASNAKVLSASYEKRPSAQINRLCVLVAVHVKSVVIFVLSVFCLSVVLPF